MVILLFMALGSLAVAYWAFGYGDSEGTPKVDSSGTFEGSVQAIKETRAGGNLIIQIDSTNMSVFVPSSSGAERVAGVVHKGDKIKVKGEISDYQGEKEIVVKSAQGVEVLSSAS